MKKTLISFLIMTLALTNIFLINIPNVQAAETDNTLATSTDDTIKVSLENIREIVIDRNLSLKIADNNLKIAKETRDNAKDTFEAKTKPGDAPKSSDIKYATDDANHTIYNADKAKYEAKVLEYKKAQSDYENAKDNLKTARENYDKIVENQVYSAQQAYLTYLNDLSTKEINEDTVNYNTKKAEIYKIQYEKGFISKNEYTSKLQGNTSVNDLNKAKDTEELDRIKLCNLLGISPEEKMTFNTDITVDFQVISKINYEEDLKQMLDNSFDIKTKSDNIDDLNDEDDDSDIHDYKVDNAEIELKQTINNAETDFRGAYNDLMASYNLLKSSYDKIIQEQNEFKITQTQYDYGFISKNALDNVKITLDKDNASFIKSKNDCYLKYLKYIQMKEGY